MSLRDWAIGAMLALAATSFAAAEIDITFDATSGPVAFGAAKLKAAIDQRGISAGRIHIDTSEKTDAPRESFAIRNGGGRILISSGDPVGAMYGALELAEQIRSGLTLDQVKNQSASPRLAFRAIKFNLPWMSYRKGEALQLHMETCRDLKFWEAFLDMMAENRFNALTLWNLHPFGYMIRPKNFPEACAFDDAQLAQWQEFWRKLFAMARDRGIEVHIFYWNIFVSPELARARNVATYSADWSFFGDADTSELVERYNREVVTQVIDEYDDLAGIGVGLGERMGKMTPQQREEWINRTVVAGIKAARRPVRFNHRAPFSANLGSGGSMDRSTEQIARQTIESLDLPSPIWVEIKFNWSHGHSSPNLNIIHGGKHTDTYWNPLPRNYRITWMIRNEDFFNLRWGEPGFIREHIRTNGGDYTGGYFVGSECYIPAKDYMQKQVKSNAANPWSYAFQRQWLFYMMWGRLLYDPATPDSAFAAELERRFGPGTGAKLLEAYTRASRMPLRLASFHKATWDFTLYSEGFCAPARSAGLFDGASPFISIDELIDHETLDPMYMSIPEFVKARREKSPIPAGRITPPALADSLDADGRMALELVRSAPLNDDAATLCETGDIKAWAYLSLYFAAKLRAGVALESYRTGGDTRDQEQAIALLHVAGQYWDALIITTRPLYHDVPLMHLGEKEKFHWAMMREQVQRDVELAKRNR